MIEMFRSFEPLMEEDTGLEVPTPETEVEETGEKVQDSAEPVTEEGEKEKEAAEPTDSKKDSNAAFAEMRRRLEAAEKENASYKQKESEWNNSKQEYEDALGLYFKGDNKVAQAMAHYQEVPVEQVINEMNAKKELNELKAQNEELQKRADKYEFDVQKAKDLQAIKKAHSDANISDVLELGEKFFQFRGMGIDPVTAYEALQLQKGIPPKAIGKAKPETPEKDTFTRDEVERMSSDERVKNYDKIRKSMTKW